MLARNVTNQPKSDVQLVKKKKKGKGSGAERGEGCAGEFLDADQVNADGEIKTLEGKIVDEEFPPILPWKARVPIRKNEPGYTSSFEKVPIGNVNSTPRVFHEETVEWVKLMMVPGAKGVGGEAELSKAARNCFIEIFSR